MLPLIYNPAAGILSRLPQLIHAIQKNLHEAGLETVLRPTAGPGGATELAEQAVERRDPMVIVCGGDGTINEAAQSLIGTSTALAIWPAGTANVLAQELKLPSDPKSLAALIARGHTRTISVGRAFDLAIGWQRYFLLMAGVGVDAAIVRGVNPKLKRWTGAGAFWASALDYLARLPLTPFSLAIDSQRYRGTFACIANAASYGGWFTLAPRADLEEAKLDVCLFDTHHRLGLLSDALLSVTSSHLRNRGVVYQKADAAFANSNDDTPVQLDGEFVGTLPMSFESIGGALCVIAPGKLSTKDHDA